MDNQIKKNSKLYNAIKDAIYTMFDGEIPIEEPSETTEKLIKTINKNLQNK